MSSHTLGFLKIGAPLNAEISNLVDIKNNAVSDLTTMRFWGTVKNDINDDDANAITKFNSLQHPHRFEFSESNSVVTVQLLTPDGSENLLSNVSPFVREATGLALFDMPVIGYIFVDIWARSNAGAGPAQIFFEKIPVVLPTTISKQ